MMKRQRNGLGEGGAVAAMTALFEPNLGLLPSHRCHSARIALPSLVAIPNRNESQKIPLRFGYLPEHFHSQYFQETQQADCHL
ncbi:hypothetical protein [Bifidobacterium subtile]|jgi:hypothetical protein|nr:hypothetical protein [Bifidobacterium subtile]QOL35806.1 hypothetical protein BS3272_07715 [Bifidobacterium subtile]